jgi:phosphate-selective porin OprO/OprP
VQPIEDGAVVGAWYQLAVAAARLAVLHRAAVFTIVVIGLPTVLWAQTRLPPPESPTLSSRLRLDESVPSQPVVFMTEDLPSPDAAASGANPEDAEPPTASEFEAVLRRLEALEKGMDKPGDEKPSAEKKPEEKKTQEKKPEDEWIDLSGEKWNVKLGGHMQLDTINWADASPQIPEFNYVEFRRLRLMADGVGYGVYDFRIQIDIEPEGGDQVNTPVTDIKDAYLTMHELPYVHRFRIGNFFVPFSLEQVTNDTNNIFLERSIPTQGIFAADREVGIAFYNVNAAQDFTWTFGTFFDSISESLKELQDDNQGQRISGRLTYLPYYDEPSNGRYMVHTGAGVLFTDDQNGSAFFRARPQIHEGPFIINSGNLDCSSYTTGNLEFAIVWGSFSFQSESFLSYVNLIGEDPAYIGGAYCYVSYFLTGENRKYERFGQHGAQFGRNEPYSNFFCVPGCCGPGAWEVKARWSNLTLNELNSGEYNDLTVGFNWYWTDRVRCMFDWIHPVTSADSTPFGATKSDIIGMRFDYNF